MTGLALTPERRTELAALLGDRPRLTAEYPPETLDWVKTFSAGRA
ncbi:hypothetical protein [Nocardia xishanensis]|uniref:Uncharacterized protein n=1 Tax=Nocardia xishanensis TaxID=238964 RepID=A0ABW7WX76_9NOCA